MPNVSHELIPILTRGEEEQWVDARRLHKFLEIGRDFSNWIKDFIQDFGFVEGRDFSPNLSKSTGGRQAIEYTITLDMAKHISMLQRNEKGMEARQYFITAEKKLRHFHATLLTGYTEVKALIDELPSTRHEGKTWYRAAQLRRMAGKCATGGLKYKLVRMKERGMAAKLPWGALQVWHVREDAVPELLCVKPSTLVAASMVNLMSHQLKLNL